MRIRCILFVERVDLSNSLTSTTHHIIMYVYGKLSGRMYGDSPPTLNKLNISNSHVLKLFEIKNKINTRK